METKEIKEMMKKMIDLHKTSFDTFFSTMVTYQNQTEKLLQTFAENTPGISEEGKKAITQWNDAYKKGIDDFKKAVDTGYTQVETLLDLDGMFVFTDQAGKMLDTLTGKSNVAPHNYVKDVMREWVNIYYKNVKNVEDFFSAVQQQQGGNKQRK